MTKHIHTVITLCIALSSCLQTAKDSSIVGLIIDPSIKTEVEKNISPSEFGEAIEDEFLIYNNRFLFEFYEDDTLILSANIQDNKSSVFKSFYYWQSDTLGIDGAYGLFGGIGFTIKIINGKATLYHMLSSDEFPSYTYNENDSLMYRIEVPCTNTKIILSEIPDSINKQVVYGYVEFKSEDYYSSRGSADGEEFLPRIKERANMRIYFKSAMIEF